MKRLSFYVLSSLALLCNYSVARAQDIPWAQTSENFWVVSGQSWTSDGRSFKFSAIKFHLGYYRLSIVDVAEFAKKNASALSRLNAPLQFSSNLIDVGIRNIFLTEAASRDVYAVFPGGWSQTLGRPEQAGLLRVGGRQIVPLDMVHKGLSAVLCLESPAYKENYYDYQIPIFYDISKPDELKRAVTCRDAVQGGPRIIDVLSPSGGQKGIEKDEINRPPQLRVVFAIDEPGRSFKPETSKENARNGYVVVTETPAHLWDVQTMLLSDTFYGPASRPYRAINMAGGGPSGLVIRNAPEPDGKIHKSEPSVFGNPSGIIGSAIVLTKVAN